MYTVDNKKIGIYLKKLIEDKYIKSRRFCKKYLELSVQDPSLQEIHNMENRLSQIFKGLKGVQITDLPGFCELLGVSCEEILSAGEKVVRTSSHVTNYDVAASDDPTVWKAYVDREDKLILNCDEYCKTILDYIFEFKNYPFLRYLMQNNIIWLTNNEEWDGYSYGAGTNIKRREPGYIDTAMPLQIQYQDWVRTQALALAVQNKDTEMLNQLRGRENPGLHYLTLQFLRNDSAKYYNEDLVCAIADADKEMQEYYSQEFVVEDMQGHQNRYIYPYIGQVIDHMLKDRKNAPDLLIRRSTQHNKQVYEQLTKLVNDAYVCRCNSFTWELKPELRVQFNARQKEIVLSDIALSKQQDMVSFYYCTEEKKVVFFASNIVHITGNSRIEPLDALIRESNEWYEKIINLKGGEDV